MFLINRTGLPDAEVKAVLQAAKVAVGSVPSKVAVRVALARYAHGVAHNWCLIRRSALGYKRKPKEFKGIDGYVELWMDHTWLDPLPVAETFFSLAAHEFRHVRDFGKGLRWDTRRRSRHDNRPQERRAFHSQARAKRRLDARADWQDAVLNLAIALEKRGTRS
jgi:hypothetical protein